MNNKTESLKEKLRQALSSTARVISDDLGINPKKNNKNSEKQDLIELENLNSKMILLKLEQKQIRKLLKKNFLMSQYLRRIYPPAHHVNHFIQLQRK